MNIDKLYAKITELNEILDESSKDIDFLISQRDEIFKLISDAMEYQNQLLVERGNIAKKIMNIKHS